MRNKATVLFTSVFITFCCSCLSAAVLRVPEDYPTIQAALDAASEGDTALLADGTYTGEQNRDLDFRGKAVTLTSSVRAENCVIDCENVGRGFVFQSGEGRDAVLQRVTIRSGYASGDTGCGGGIFCSGASPTIKECIVTGNTAHDYGGGIDCAGSSPFILSCSIMNNHANEGAGIDCRDSSSPVISGCLITGNTAESFGGGVISYYFSSPLISNTGFSENSAGILGGAVYIHFAEAQTYNCRFNGNSAAYGGGIFARNASSTEFIDNLIVNNSASAEGAGIACMNSSPDIINCTMAFNTAGSGTGGACLNMNGSEPEIFNCILWGNHPDQVSNDQISVPVVQYSIVEGGYEGEGNVDENPLFIQGPSGDYYLSQTAAGQASDSPGADSGDRPAQEICLNAAYGTICLDEMTTRTDEISDAGTVDMGFHYRPSSYITPTPAPSDTPTAFPTVTHTATDRLGVDLDLSRSVFKTGDLFLLTASIINQTSISYPQIPLIILLDIYGEYYWHPGWTQEFDYMIIERVDPGAMDIPVLYFIWPDEENEGTGARFYGGLLSGNFLYLLGYWDIAEFGWTY